MDFGGSLGFRVPALGVEGIYGFDSLTQLRDRHSETMGNEDTFQDGECNRGDLEHQSKRAGAPKIFGVERVLRGCQVPGVVTSDHIDKNDTKGPDVGFEGRVRDKVAFFIEALWNRLSEKGTGDRGQGNDLPGLR